MATKTEAEIESTIGDVPVAKFPFCLPDGTPLGYSLPGWKGKRIFNCEKLEEFSRYINPHNRKVCLLKVWTKNNRKNERQVPQYQHLIFADFDRLPITRSQRSAMTRKSFDAGNDLNDLPHYGENYSAKYASWGADMATQLKEKGHDVYTFPTRSGKIKFAIVLEFEHKRLLTAPQAAEYIKQIFPEECHEYIDLSPNGIFTTYLRPGLKEEFAKQIQSLTPIRAKNPGEEAESEDAAITLPRTSHKYHTVETLPEEFANLDIKGKEAELLKILLAMPNLVAKSGFGLSQIIVANTLNCTQRYAGYLLKRLVDRGLLECIDSHYHPGVKAMTYQARGLLRQAIKAIKKVGAEVCELPTKIADGEWHQWMLRAITTKFRTRPFQFIQWMRSIPGSDRKDRRYQAQRLYEWFCKKHPKSHSIA